MISPEPPDGTRPSLRSPDKSSPPGAEPDASESEAAPSGIPPARSIPAEPDPPQASAPPEVDLDGLDGEGRALVRVEGRAGHAEWLLPEAFAALEAGALVVWLPAPTGWPRRLRVRLYRYSGPAWYRGAWQGRGEWYAGVHVPASVPWRGRRTVNLYLGKWRAPGVRSRAANAKTAPPPLSPEGVRRAVRLVCDRLARG